MLHDPKNTRIALVAGATGLVGQAILTLLLADAHYSAIHVLGRRAPKVFVNALSPSEQLGERVGGSVTGGPTHRATLRRR